MEVGRAVKWNREGIRQVEAKEEVGTTEDWRKKSGEKKRRNGVKGSESRNGLERKGREKPQQKEAAKRLKEMEEKENLRIEPMKGEGKKIRRRKLRERGKIR